MKEDEDKRIQLMIDGGCVVEVINLDEVTPPVTKNELIPFKSATVTESSDIVK